MKRFSLVVVLAIVLILPGIAGANLIVAGDFNGSPSITDSDFSGSTGPFGQWLGNPVWTIAPSGGPDSTAYANHSTEGRRLYQGFDASGISSGTLMNLSFEYIYQTGYTGTEEQVWVFGLTNTQGMSRFPPIIESTGQGYFGGVTPDILYQTPIAIKSNWFAFSDSFTVTGNYSSILLVFGFNAFGADASGLRGLDNINFDVAPIPEPGTMLLLGSGLVGLIGYGKRRFKK